MKPLAALALAVALGCNRAPAGDGPLPDLAFQFPADDLAAPTPNACGEITGHCYVDSYVAPLPLQSTTMDPHERDSGVIRGANGSVVLARKSSTVDFLWPANTGDWKIGSVSKFDAKTIREVARYFTVTCNSHRIGDQSGPCDFNGNGCCAADSLPQWDHRRSNQPPGPPQAVNQSNNLPSRTAVDVYGDAWVANRAYTGRSSVTKIANDPGDCIDRNGNGRIDTSRDVNLDGVIDTDCNSNGVPDDVVDVQSKGCTNGMTQEFYGLNDECILFTTNIGAPMTLGGPLALAPSAGGPSDAWAGSNLDGHFYRIDGTTGLTTDEADVVGCKPYGLVIDSSGIGWTLNTASSPLCYFNTKNTKEVGTARNPTTGKLSGVAVALDADQNIWIGCLAFGVCRYTPDRSGDFATLGGGGWTMIANPGRNNGATTAVGIAVDRRRPNLYFAWAAGGSSITRLEASSLPAAKPATDTLIDGSAWPSVVVAGKPEGVGIDSEQNVWSVSQGPAVVTRIRVDAQAAMTAPDIQSPPQGQNRCPGGDRCGYDGPDNPSPDTDSDFAGFARRNFSEAQARWSWVQQGCGAVVGIPGTKWVSVSWDGDVPPRTAIVVRARTGDTPVPDGSWTPFTSFDVSPADLINLPRRDFLQVEFDLSSTDASASPALNGFHIKYACP